MNSEYTFNVYMYAFVLKSHNIPQQQLNYTVWGLLQLQGTPVPSQVNEILTYRPKKSQMIKWLHKRGFSQKTIANILQMSQQAVSASLSRTAYNPAYYNPMMEDLMKNYRAYNAIYENL